MASKIFRQTTQTLLAIGEELEREAKKNLVDHKHTGRLSRRTQARLVDKAGEMRLQIVTLAYGDVLDKGLAGKENPGIAPYRAVSSRGQTASIRGSVVRVNWKDIKKWSEAKGIKNSYLVHMKILRLGYAGKRWFKKAQEKTLKDDRYANRIAISYKKDVMDFIRIRKRQ